MNEDLRFYSKSDIKYCIQLLKKKKDNGTCKESFFNRYIYEWNDAKIKVTKFWLLHSSNMDSI